MTSLQDLYVNELRDMLNAENQILKALPKMAKKASSPQLSQAFEQHLEQTRQHVQRLNRIFESMGQTPRSRKCKGIEGIIEEGKDFMDQADS
ncbi:MAG TPA: DUF892 family protein, partial [Tepidisphaeraceae bacterium]|nr:DUF892 family protein [Tepidisphaeraceae bacterium]